LYRIMILLFYGSHCSWDDRFVHHHVQLYSNEMDLVNFFCLSWPGTANLPSQSPTYLRMTGTPPHPVTGCDRVRQTFCQGGPQPQSSRYQPSKNIGLQVWATIT
jgi:hypothetical protein